jgi:DNA-binding transcriptional regulator YhcF (GntR family)
MTVATTYIDKKSPYPLYHQMKELIREKIAAGEWKPGGPIPAKLQLCKTYHVSMATVNQAVSELQTEGLLEPIQGRGTYVADKKAAQRRIAANTQRGIDGPRFENAVDTLFSCIDYNPHDREAVRGFLERFAEHIIAYTVPNLSDESNLATMPDYDPVG